MTSTIPEDAQKKLVNDFSNHFNNTKKHYQTLPGFFSPFLNKQDFTQTLINPVNTPIRTHGYHFIYFAVMKLAAVLACPLFLLAAVITAPFSLDFAKFMLGMSAVSVLFAVTSLVASIGHALAIPLSAVLLLGHLVTRIGATIVNAMGCLPEEEVPEQSSDCNPLS